MSGSDPQTPLPASAPAAAPGPVRANPFVGPRPLEKGQPIFGRDAEIDQLYYRLSAERILLFHSPSGAGKSSLLQAGLLPRLAAQFDVWAPARVSLPPGPADSAGINRYVRSCNLSFETEVPKDLQRPEFAIASMSLADYVSARPRRRSAPKNTVLIFDQFEEILTVDPLAYDPRRDFFLQLGLLLQNPRIWAIFALREDYLAQLDPFAEEVPTHLKNRFRLDLLSCEAAQEAVAKSVEAAGRSFSPDALTRLVSDLALTQVQQPSGEFRSEPGRSIEPLHLQVTGRALWERLCDTCDVIQLADVSAFGNVTTALSTYYADEVARASAAAPDPESTQRDIRLWCGERLITRGNIRAQILREPNSSGGLDNHLIQALIDSHLVRAESRSSATWYELAHDRLIEPVHQDNARWLAAHLNLAQSRALEWQRSGEPEGLLLTGLDLIKARRWAAAPGRRLTLNEDRFLIASRRRQRQLLRNRVGLVLLLVAFVAALAAALWASHEQTRALSNLSIAEQAALDTISAAGVQQDQEFPDSPAVMALRGRIIQSAASSFSRLSAENLHSSSSLRMNAAQGYVYLADNYRLLDKFSDALSQYRLAIQQFQALAADYPRNSAVQLEAKTSIAYCYTFLGETWRSQSELSSPPNQATARQALQQYDLALAIEQPLHNAAPAAVAPAQALARTSIDRGIVEWEAFGNDKAAASDYRTAIHLLQPFAKSTSDNSPPAEDLDRAENDLGALIYNSIPPAAAGAAPSPQLAQARPFYDDAVRLATSLNQANPSSNAYLAELAISADNQAKLLRDMNDLAAAATASQQALTAMQGLSTPAPRLSLKELEVLNTRAGILITFNQGGWAALDAIDRERLLLDSLGGNSFLSHHPNAQVRYSDIASNYVALANEALTATNAPGNLQVAFIALNGLQRTIPQLSTDEQKTATLAWQQISAQLSTALAAAHNTSPAPSNPHP